MEDNFNCCRIDCNVIASGKLSISNNVHPTTAPAPHPFVLIVSIWFEKKRQRGNNAIQSHSRCQMSKECCSSRRFFSLRKPLRPFVFVIVIYVAIFSWFHVEFVRLYGLVNNVSHFPFIDSPKSRNNISTTTTKRCIDMFPRFEISNWNSICSFWLIPHWIIKILRNAWFDIFQTVANLLRKSFEQHNFYQITHILANS